MNTSSHTENKAWLSVVGVEVAALVLVLVVVMMMVEAVNARGAHWAVVVSRNSW